MVSDDSISISMIYYSKVHGYTLKEYKKGQLALCGLAGIDFSIRLHDKIGICHGNSHSFHIVWDFGSGYQAPFIENNSSFFTIPLIWGWLKGPWLKHLFDHPKHHSYPLPPLMVPPSTT